MLAKIRNGIQTFFYGRNGVDQMFQPLIIGVVILSFASLFVTNGWWELGLGAASTALLVYAFWRMLSKNISKRRAENAKYLKLENSVKNSVSMTVRRIKERKTSVFPKCPNCKERFRLPRVKGKHTAKCPRCAHTFKVTIR